MLVKLFCHILEYFWGYVQFWRCFRPTKHPKIVTDPLNGFEILQICLHPLEYIIIFLTKFLFKLLFGDFQIFLRLCSLFTIFVPQKPPKNHYRSLEEVWHKPHLLLLFKIAVKILEKFVFYIAYCKLRGMFCFIKICNFWNLLIWMLNCSKCTESIFFFLIFFLKKTAFEHRILNQKSVTLDGKVNDINNFFDSIAALNR